MLLHEVFFDSLGASQADPGLARSNRLEPISAALDKWARRSSPPWARRWAAARAGFCWPGRRATAGSSTPGRPTTPATLAGATPLLALDMYEHSYHMDFGAKAGAYVDAFMNNLNLATASPKLAAIKLEPEPWNAPSSRTI